MKIRTIENTYLIAGEVNQADIDRIFKTNPWADFIKLAFPFKTVTLIERSCWDEFKEFIKELEKETATTV